MKITTTIGQGGERAPLVITEDLSALAEPTVLVVPAMPAASGPRVDPAPAPPVPELAIEAPPARRRPAGRAVAAVAGGLGGLGGLFGAGLMFGASGAGLLLGKFILGGVALLAVVLLLARLGSRGLITVRGYRVD